MNIQLCGALFDCFPVGQIALGGNFLSRTRSEVYFFAPFKKWYIGLSSFYEIFKT